ncbi:MAG: metallophosphatase family protein [Deltaproteobacteria bacterium]|nr:metallophosphatase family protein [Deltaproteobacteria bacterium]
MKVGVISDTHGQIHPHVFDYFNEVELILHAGDVGNEGILSDLETLAPVKAVLGNTDSFPLTEKCREKEILILGDKKTYLTHKVIEFGRLLPSVMNDIDSINPDIVVFGHTHEQHVKVRGNTLFFNPGGGGQKRPGKKLAVGILEIRNGDIDHSIHYLD